ncbi:MAG: IS1634 family transposase [Ghiorsea sp.]
MIAAMYIRQTTTRRKKDESTYQTYRLVESIRIGDKVKQRTLLNLGSDFSVPRDDWGDLTSRIEGILHHQPSLIAVGELIEAEAQRIAASLLKRNKEYAPSDAEVAASTDYCDVDINSLESSNLRSVGVEHLAYQALESLQLDTKLKELGFNASEVSAAMGTIIGRMAAPGSERSTHRWLQQESGLGDLIGSDFNQCSLSRMYRVSDLLLKHRDALETHLFERERDLFNLDCTITLYDLTNTFFEGGCQSNDLAARGRSKEKRSDCPLVTLALMLDSSGFPRSSKVFAGNAGEAATLKEMVETLVKIDSNPLIVMDAGISTEANITWLKEQGYRYLVVSRKRYIEWDEDKAAVIREEGNNKVQAYSKQSTDGEETELYCRSSSRAEKEKAMDTLFAERFEASMQVLADGLSKPRCVKKYDVVLKRIGRFKEKFARAAQHYTIEVDHDEHKLHATAVRFTRTNHASVEYAGVYCLRTNITGWDDKKLWETYVMLTDIEAVFRSMKSELGMRPIFHQTTERVEGHLWITLLAYHLVHTIRLKLKEQGNHDSWETIRRTMRGHHRVTTTIRTKQGQTLHVRKAARPEAWQQSIYKMLNLNQNPGGTIKTIVPD